MVYKFHKESNKFFGEYGSVKLAAKSLSVRPTQVQSVLDGKTESIKGFSFIYKPEDAPVKHEEVSYQERRREQFYELADELVTWEQAVLFRKDDKTDIMKQDVTLTVAINLLKAGWIVIPFLRR